VIFDAFASLLNLYMADNQNNYKRWEEFKKFKELITKQKE